MRQSLIRDAVRAAERNGSNPRALIRTIQEDPQYGSDPEVSDLSD
jgi:hypothetical protein